MKCFVQGGGNQYAVVEEGEKSEGLERVLRKISEYSEVVLGEVLRWDEYSCLLRNCQNLKVATQPDYYAELLIARVLNFVT